MEENQTVQREVPRETLPLSMMKRIVALIAAPSELMENIKTHPVIFAPFLLAFVIGLITIVPGREFTQIFLHEQQNLFAERFPDGGSPFDAASALADEYGDGDVSQEVINVVVIVGLAAGAATNPFFISIFATLGIFILSKILKGKCTFTQTFSMYMHVYVIVALGSLVVATVVALTGNIVDMTSLAAAVMPNGRLDDAMFHVFSAIGIFPVWATVLTFIGVKVLNEFSNAKAAIVSVIVFAAYVGFHVVARMLNWWLLDIFPALGAT